MNKLQINKYLDCVTGQWLNEWVNGYSNEQISKSINERLIKYLMNIH